MKTLIICGSDPYYVRGLQLKEAYEKMGDEVQVITPDYSHSHKAPFTTEDPSTILVHQRPYQKNMSVDRLGGLYFYARRALEKAEELQPDRLHILVPANSLARYGAKYKKKHPEVQLIFDVNDLWPESLPMHGLSKTPPALLWKNLRDNSLQAADLIFCECSLFINHLKEKAPQVPFVRLPWKGPQTSSAGLQRSSSETLRLCYLGSISHITDLDALEQFVKAASSVRPVSLDIIGSGQSKEEMKERISKYARVYDHGAVYDEEEKMRIFAGCDLGINMMKPHIQVGLSMKSLDYLAAGLPLLNLIGSDTWNWVEEYQAGINLNRQKLEEDALKTAALSADALKSMSENASRLYREQLSPQKFEQILQKSVTEAAV